MGFELELLVILGLHVVGTAVFTPFEVETPAIRKIAKWVIITLLTWTVFNIVGHWALLVPLFGVALGMVVHMSWTRKNNIHPIHATPRKRYYALRGWHWPEE